jgi:uncharacterized protein YdhG (YjbR/CyaY superfamily)
MNTPTTPQNIDEYIAQFPEDRQAILQKTRAVIHKAAPNAAEKISYGMPTITLNGRNLVHFAMFKNHLGFYPTPSGIESFKADLAKHTNSKGAVQFTLDKPIPYTLIAKITKFRVKENLAKAKASPRQT